MRNVDNDNAQKLVCFSLQRWLFEFLFLVCFALVKLSQKLVKWPQDVKTELVQSPFATFKVKKKETEETVY